MARQQERSQRTQTAIMDAARAEFGKRGYAGASVNGILAESKVTKGAMYFHFESKEDLGRAVVDAALEKLEGVTSSWVSRLDIEPFEALAGMTDEIARLFQSDAALQAEYRLMLEPEFNLNGERGGIGVLARATRTLLDVAVTEGFVAENVNTEKVARMFATGLAGQMYVFNSGSRTLSLQEMFAETLEMVVNPWLRQAA